MDTPLYSNQYVGQKLLVNLWTLVRPTTRVRTNVVVVTIIPVVGYVVRTVSPVVGGV